MMMMIIWWCHSHIHWFCELSAFWGKITFFLLLQSWKQNDDHGGHLHIQLYHLYHLYLYLYHLYFYHLHHLHIHIHLCHLYHHQMAVMMIFMMRISCVVLKTCCKTKNITGLFPKCPILDFLWWVQGEHRSNLIFVNVKLPRARCLGLLALAVEHRVEELPGHLHHVSASEMHEAPWWITIGDIRGRIGLERWISGCGDI